MNRGRAATGLALATIAVLAVAAASQLWRIAGADHGVPLWDPAEHGVAGVALAGALRRGDLIGFLLGINRQVMWPFAHSLMLLPWTLAFGGDYLTAARLSCVLFAATVVALYVAGTGLHPSRGAWVGCAAAALALLAPLYRVFGSLCMLEMPGALLLALTAALHVRARDASAPRPLLIAAGASSAGLFFCKYNYGLLWLIPLAIHEWRAVPPEQRRAVSARVSTWFAERRWQKPFPIFIALYTTLVLAIIVTGGGEFVVAGAKVSVRSPGNPLYGLYLIVLAWAALRMRRAGGVRAVTQSLSARHRILIATILIPIAVWFLIPEPNRFRTFFDFVVNRDTAHSPLSLARWLAYPRAFVRDYSPTPWVGWIVLALALVPPRRPWSVLDPRVLIYLAMGLGLVATASHHYHQPRFLFTVAPLIWLCAACTAVSWLDWALALVPRSLGEVVWAAALAGLPVWAVLGAPPAAATASARSWLSSPASFVPMLDRILDLAEGSQTTPWCLGYANILSPGLVRWQGLLTHPKLPERQLPEHAPMLAPEASDEALAARIERLRASGRPVLAVLSTRRFAGDGEYRWETRADSVTAARLAADPGMVVEVDQAFEDAGFRLSVYRFSTPPAGATSGR